MLERSRVFRRARSVAMNWVMLCRRCGNFIGLEETEVTIRLVGLADGVSPPEFECWRCRTERGRRIWL